MKPRVQLNQRDVLMAVADAGDTGISTTRLVEQLGVKRTVLQQHLWRLVKGGHIQNSNPIGGSSEGHWTALEIPYAGAADISDIKQSWLPAGKYLIEIPKAPTSVWDLGRRRRAG